MFIKHVFRNKEKGAFTSVTILEILLIIFSSIAILQVEKDPNSNIKTAEDAIWWAYVMTAGVGLFGTFTAYVSSWFVVVKEI